MNIKETIKRWLSYTVFVHQPQIKIYKKRLNKTRPKKASYETVELTPSEKLVLGVKAMMVVFAGLVAIEVAFIIATKEINREVLTAIVSLASTIIGVFFGARNIEALRMN